jgi:uncharacterized protein
VLLPLLLAAASFGCPPPPARTASVRAGREDATLADARLARVVRADRVPARVMDDAGVLPAAVEARVSMASEELERRTGHQFVVAVEPSLRGLPIERFSLALFGGLKIGRACCDDGVGLLIAPKERKARIEVGRGLETELTDCEAQHIMDHVIVPHFARGDFPGGVEAGTRAIIAEIDA